VGRWVAGTCINQSACPLAVPPAVVDFSTFDCSFIPFPIFPFSHFPIFPFSHFPIFPFFHFSFFALRRRLQPGLCTVHSLTPGHTILNYDITEHCTVRSVEVYSAQCSLLGPLADFQRFCSGELCRYDHTSCRSVILAFFDSCLAVVCRRG